MNVCSSHDQMRYEIYHPRNHNVSTILNQCLVLHKSQLQGLVLCSACCTRGLGQIKGFAPVFHGLFIKELYQLGLSHSLKSFKWNSQSWSTAVCCQNQLSALHAPKERGVLLSDLQLLSSLLSWQVSLVTKNRWVEASKIWQMMVCSRILQFW